MEIRPSGAVATGEEFSDWAVNLDGNAPTLARAALHLSSTLDLDEALGIAVLHLEEILGGLPFAIIVPGEDERKYPRLAVGGSPWNPGVRNSAESLLRESLPEFKFAARGLIVNWDLGEPGSAQPRRTGSLDSKFRVVTLEAHGSSLGVIGVAVPVEGLADRVLATIESFRAPISHALYNAKMHARLRSLAFRDCLTGLYNRRAFEEMMEVQVAHARRHNRPLSLLMLDVDQLKVINDRFGHDSGDVVLSEVARLLSRLVRDCDLPARTGGDEFSVILPDTAGESAKFIALRLSAGLRCDVAIPGLGALTVAVSIGTASSGGDDLLDANELRRSADEALYGQKKERANTLPRVHADPSTKRRSGRL